MTIPKIPCYPCPPVQEFPANRTSWVLQPQKALLLVHDMQDYFLDYFASEQTKDWIVSGCRTVIEACRSWDIPVVYSAQPTGQTPESRGLLSDMWGPGLDQRPEQKQIVASIGPQPEDRVLIKSRYSAFKNSNLKAIMEEHGRDQLIICGIYGHIGCLMTAAEAFMEDIKPFMVGDAIGDFSLEDHHMTLRYVATRCGHVISLKHFGAEKR